MRRSIEEGGPMSTTTLHWNHGSRTGPIASVLASGLFLAACSGPSGPTLDEPVGQAASAIDDGNAPAGKHHFDDALPHTNGRACATCHVEAEHFALSPQHVVALRQQNPGDPLFNPIDADDPAASPPTYAHLQAGLVRVTIPLADNLDVIDAAGNVI